MMSNKDGQAYLDYMLTDIENALGRAAPELVGVQHCLFRPSTRRFDTIMDAFGTNFGIWGNYTPKYSSSGLDYELEYEGEDEEFKVLWSNPENRRLARNDAIFGESDSYFSMTIPTSVDQSVVNWIQAYNTEYHMNDMLHLLPFVVEWSVRLPWMYVPFYLEVSDFMVVLLIARSMPEAGFAQLVSRIQSGACFSDSYIDTGRELEGEKAAVRKLVESGGSLRLVDA